MAGGLQMKSDAGATLVGHRSSLPDSVVVLFDSSQTSIHETDPESSLNTNEKVEDEHYSGHYSLMYYPNGTMSESSNPKADEVLWNKVLLIIDGEDGKFNLGLNYEAGENRPDYRTDGRFGVTLQTQISDKVLINGKVGVPVGGAGANETVIAGDVEIDFLLNEEGTLTAKVFNRENSIRNFGEAIGYTQGVGLSYNVDFDTFKELIQNLFKKNKKEAEDIQEEVKENGPNKVPDFVSYKSPSKKEN